MLQKSGFFCEKIPRYQFRREGGMLLSSFFIYTNTDEMNFTINTKFIGIFSGIEEM